MNDCHHSLIQHQHHPLPHPHQRASEMDTPPSITTLPLELWRNVFQYLARRDLAACAQVDKSWSGIVTPFIWRSLDVPSNKQTALFNADEVQQALARNARYVQDLTINMTNLMVFNSVLPDQPSNPLARTPICTRVKKLTLKGSLRKKNRLESDAYIRWSLIALVRHNPLLTDLVFQNDPVDQDAVVEMVRYAQRLRRLWIQPSCRSGYTRKILSVLPASIKSVDLRVNDWEYYRANISELSFAPPVTLPSLKWININGDVGADMVLPLLNACSGPLSEFRKSTIRPFQDDKTRAVLESLRIFLECIQTRRLPDGDRTEDQAIAKMVSLSSRLTRIDLASCRLAGSLTTAAILDNCERVEYLNLSGCGEFEWSGSVVRSQDLQAILCRTPNLKSLIAIHSFDPSPRRSVALRAEDMIGSKWATTSLETFCCKIYVQRSDQLMNDHEGPEDCDTVAKQARALCQQVFARLATLKKMQFIQLNRKYEGPVVQRIDPDTLEVTLESGLSALSGLKEMEYLDVSKIGHHISVPELNWMCRHWPRLRSIGGLLQEFQALLRAPESGSTETNLTGPHHWFRRLLNRGGNTNTAMLMESFNPNKNSHALG